MVERPVLQHARVAMGKAERFAEKADQVLPQAYETIVHNSYDAIFHGARAALLAIEGSASTNHGGVVKAFRELVRRRRNNGDEDLTEAGRSLRAQVRPFLGFCRELVDMAAPGS